LPFTDIVYVFILSVRENKAAIPVALRGNPDDS